MDMGRLPPSNATRGPPASVACGPRGVIVIVLATRGRLFLYVGIVAPFRAVPTAVADGLLARFAHAVAVAGAGGQHLDGTDVNLCA